MFYFRDAFGLFIGIVTIINTFILAFIYPAFLEKLKEDKRKKEKTDTKQDVKLNPETVKELFLDYYSKGRYKK